MNKEIFKTKYIQIYFDETSKIYTSIYLPESENMTDKEWKALMLDVVKIIGTLKPEYIVDDNSERKYDYPPDVQKWTLNLFVKSWNKIKLKKYVQVLPIHIIGQITTEQIKELSDTKFLPRFESRVVSDFETALSWINE